jgi:hypothetical protein
MNNIFAMTALLSFSWGEKLRLAKARSDWTIVSTRSRSAAAGSRPHAAQAGLLFAQPFFAQPFEPVAIQTAPD